jgi:tight adherence protein B
MHPALAAPEPASLAALLPFVAGAMVAAAVLVWPSRLRGRTGGRPLGLPGSRLGSRAGSGRGGGEDLQLEGMSATVVMELVAAALRAGLPGPQAVEAAATACGPRVGERLARPLDAWRLGIPADRAWASVDGDFAPLARSLVLAERTGASAAVLLAAAAADARSARQRRAVVAARRLGVQLVLPLGLTTLPAFVLMGVVPVVLGLASGLLDAG